MDRGDSDIEKRKKEKEELEKKRIDPEKRAKEITGEGGANPGGEVSEPWFERKNRPDEIQFNDTEKDALRDIRHIGIGLEKEFGKTFYSTDDKLAVRASFEGGKDKLQMHHEVGDVGSFHFHPRDHAFSEHDFDGLGAGRDFIGVVCRDGDVYVAKATDGFKQSKIEDLKKEYKKTFDKEIDELKETRKKYGECHDDPSDHTLEKIATENACRSVLPKHELDFYMGSIDGGLINQTHNNNFAKHYGY